MLESEEVVFELISAVGLDSYDLIPDEGISKPRAVFDGNDGLVFDFTSDFISESLDSFESTLESEELVFET